MIQLVTKQHRVQFQIIWRCQGVGNVLSFSRDKQMRSTLASVPLLGSLVPLFHETIMS